MVHLERWFCRRNFYFSEVEVTERVISTLPPMEWKLLFHFRKEKLRKNPGEKITLIIDMEFSNSIIVRGLKV